MLNWTHLTIRSNEDAEHMRQLFHTTTHTAAAFDTETTGLNHMRDKPFLYQFGWCDIESRQGWTFVVDLEQQPILAKQVIKVWHALVKHAPIYLGHNVKFDLHMCTNINLPYRETNISDTSIWIRLGSNAVPVRKGGPPMALKDFAAKYISPEAKKHEALLKQERTAIASQYNLQLRRRLGWTKKQIDKFFNDKVNDADDLPTDKCQAYYDWKHLDLPLYLQEKITGAVDSDMIRYDKLNRENVIHYGHLDVVWTLEIYLLMHQIVVNRVNLDAVKREEANIYPLFDMERVGFKIDKAYLLRAKDKVKNYIRERRADFARLANCEITIGQHELIRTVLLQQYGLAIDTTNADELDLLISNLKHEGNHEQAVEFLETLQELRTLEKWYSTYILRFVYSSQFSDRLYTTVNQTGTVSGRVTSDFQQFPKGGIVSITGEELFHPRKLILVSGGEFIGTVYLDYSQIELRLQAMFTILVGHADLNLCRAYMPYKCHLHTTDKFPTTDPVDLAVAAFDYTNIVHLRHAYDWHWYLDEAPETRWTPTDVHGATTKLAFGINEDDPNFHDLRYKGKRVNFAKNYGAQFGKIKTMFPEYDDEQIHKIDDAYYQAFPGVKSYHKYCYTLAVTQPYAQNLFGVKYYGVSGHNLINMLVQGTGAYYLKWKIVQVTEYLKSVGAKSRWQMQIHDELSFEWHKDDPPEMWFEVKRIMEDWSDGLIPIIADMELTKTCWAEKFEVEGVEDLVA